MRPMKRSGDPDITKYWSNWQPKNFFCQSPCLIVPDDSAMLDVWLSKYAYLFQYFYVGQPKFVRTPNVPTGWSAGQPRIFCLLQHCWCFSTRASIATVLNLHLCFSSCLGVNIYLYIDGWVQDCSNSIGNTLELLQSCTKPSTWSLNQVQWLRKNDRVPVWHIVAFKNPSTSPRDQWINPLRPGQNGCHLMILQLQKKFSNVYSSGI